MACEQKLFKQKKCQPLLGKASCHTSLAFLQHQVDYNQHPLASNPWIIIINTMREKHYHVDGPKAKFTKPYCMITIEADIITFNGGRRG